MVTKYAPSWRVIVPWQPNRAPMVLLRIECHRMFTCRGNPLWLPRIRAGTGAFGWAGTGACPYIVLFANIKGRSGRTRLPHSTSNRPGLSRAGLGDTYEAGASSSAASVCSSRYVHCLPMHLTAWTFPFRRSSTSSELHSGQRRSTGLSQDTKVHAGYRLHP